MAHLHQLIKQAIAENTVMVFSKSYCSYSIRTKDLLEDLSIDYKAMELNEHPDGASIQEILLKLTQQKTVPNIFIREKHLGGYDALQAAVNTGQFKMLLEGK
ncbi:glutaredoxin [Spinellus fusiger]|nr:glutaredoxin [Spinellus fusiger]